MLARLILVLAMLTTEHAASAEIAARVRTLKPDNPAQRIALASTRPEFAFMGRRLGGKSWVIGAKSVRYADTYGPNHPRGYPPARVMIGRKERVTMTESIVRTIREEILGPELFHALYRGTTKDGEDGLYFPNGSSIVFRGLNDPERILGMRYGLCLVDQAEQLDETQKELALSGTMQPGMPWSQFFCAFNPEHPEHWAYLSYLPDDGDGPRYRKGDAHSSRQEGSDWKHFADVVHVRENDCLHFVSLEQVETLDNLTGVHRERLRHGRWVSYTGVVHDLWDPRIHVISEKVNQGGYKIPAECFEWSDGSGGPYPPPHWKRWRGVDFGYNPDPYSVVWFALSPEGAWHLYRQDYRLRLTLTRQTSRIKNQQRREAAALIRGGRAWDRSEIESGRPSRRLRENWEDLRGGLSYTGVSDHGADQRAMYAKAGVKSWPANKDWWAGYDTMRELLDPKQPGGPRFFVWANSLIQRDQLLVGQKRPTCFQEEVGRYLWATQKTAAGAVSVKDTPVDANNHAQDAARYVVHTWATRRAAMLTRDEKGKSFDEDGEV